MFVSTVDVQATSGPGESHFFHIDALSVIGINMSVCVCVYVHICMCMCADKCGYSGAASAGRCDK